MTQTLSRQQSSQSITRKRDTTKQSTATKTKTRTRTRTRTPRAHTPRAEETCKGLSFSDCEIAILRVQVDAAEKKVARRRIEAPEVREIFAIVEAFIKKRKCIVYGGLAIDKLLPAGDKIYSSDTDLPDYDFYSPHALRDAKALGDEYAAKGYEEIEVKAGQHHNTFKVFVGYMSVADITLMAAPLFAAVKRNAVSVDGMLVADPNLLRLGMFLELSRPDGAVDRHEKVLKRLIKINRHYPLTKLKCDRMQFQRAMDPKNRDQEQAIYETTLQSLVDEGVVFFGGYALTLYSRYMPPHLQRKLRKFPDFDVLSTTPKETADRVKERLTKEADIAGSVTVTHRDGVGEIVPEHYEIKVGDDTVAFVYKPVACHSYNVLRLHGETIKVATIDTMLSFYLAFLYADRPYYDKDRILCMAKFLFDVQQKNRLSQRGLLKRFSIECYGHQPTLEEMRAEKAAKFEELRGKQGKPEYEEWFLNYRPKTSAAAVTRRRRGAETAATKSATSSATKSTTTAADTTPKRRRTRRRKKKSGFFWGGRDVDAD